MEISNEMIDNAIKISNKTTEILKTYNEMLHSGKYSREECYDWLMQQRALYPEIPDFAFLYPEQISLDDIGDKDDLSAIPTSYLQMMINSVYGTGEYLNSPEYLKMYNAINAEIQRRMTLEHVASKHIKESI